MGQIFCAQCQLDESDNQIIQELFLQKCINGSEYILPQNMQAAFEILKTQKMYFNLSHTEGVLYGKKFGFYQGQINSDKFAHGKGRLIFPNQNQYIGAFCNGKFQGEGQLIDNKNNIKFKGLWKNGQPIQGDLQRQNLKIKLSQIKIYQGGKINAKLSINNSIEYQGDLLQKILDKKTYLSFQGRGKMKFPDGAQYDGQWYDSKMEGYGQYTWKNGNRYKGNYKNGLRDGIGEMFWKDSNQIYNGFWVKGEPSQGSRIQMGRENIDLSQN